MKEKFYCLIKKLPSLVICAILAVLLFLFFVNDFGLVDIHKTSVVMSLGIDIDGEDLLVTAQIAVPQPSENGENTSFTEVSGKGATVADALNEINSKTGFYPKLLFCRLILIGEDCKNKNLFELLDYFYRNEYSQYSALVAMCKGKAGDLLKKPTPMANMTTLSIQRILSEELKKSANVSTVNLKMIAQTHYSKSNACYMPYIESSAQGQASGGEQSGEKFNSKQSQDSENKHGSGGESSSKQGEKNGKNGGGQEQGGSSKQDGGKGQSGSSSKQGGGGKQGEQANEFTCRKTAAFSNGKFTGVLNEEQAFALNLLKNDIRLAIVSAQSNGKDYAIGLRNSRGKERLNLENGAFTFSLTYSAKARIQGVTEASTPKKLAENDVITKDVINATSSAIKSAAQSLVEFCVKNNCDLLGVKDMLYKFYKNKFNVFEKDFLNKINVAYDIKISGAK